MQTVMEMEIERKFLEGAETDILRIRIPNRCWVGSEDIEGSQETNLFGNRCCHRCGNISWSYRGRTAIQRVFHQHVRVTCNLGQQRRIVTCTKIWQPLNVYTTLQQEQMEELMVKDERTNHAEVHLCFKFKCHIIKFNKV